MAQAPAHSRSPEVAVCCDYCWWWCCVFTPRLALAERPQGWKRVCWLHSEASFSFGIRQACLSCHVLSPDPPSASGVLRSPWTLPDKANGCFSSRSLACLPFPKTHTSPWYSSHMKRCSEGEGKGKGRGESAGGADVSWKRLK